MKLCVIRPVKSTKQGDRRRLRALQHLTRQDVKLSMVSLDNGPPSIETEYDEALATPGVIQRTQEVSRRKVEAIVIDCMIDPALPAAREIVNIPVIGPGEASMALASMLSNRWSIVTVMKSLIPIFQRRAMTYGFDRRLVSVRSIEIPVLDLQSARQRMEQKLLEESRAALEEGAHAIILGCTGIEGVARKLQQKLGVPVIDPTAASLKLAEVLVDLRLQNSRLSYPQPMEAAKPT